MADQQQTPGAHGAVDLSRMNPAGQGQSSDPSSPGAAGSYASMQQDDSAYEIAAPLVAPLTEANFEAEVALSQTVPVVVLLVSAGSLPSNDAQQRLEAAARSFAGSFVVRVADVEANAQLAAALQVQNIPMAIALIGGRPVPLFEGAPTEAQINDLLSQVLDAAKQMGVTGRVSVGAADLEEKEPESHAAPRAAEEEGDWTRAIALWKKVLANDPSDGDAKLALARAKFEKRQVQLASSEASDVPDPLSQADRLFASGSEAEAFDLLLEQISAPPSPEAKEAARERLVQLFTLGSNPEAVKEARKRLSLLLF